MPRRRTVNAPPKDPVKALILERMNALQMEDRLSKDGLAVSLGVAPNTFRSMMNRHTDTWRMADIKRCCRLLGVTVEELRAATRL